MGQIRLILPKELHAKLDEAIEIKLQDMLAAKAKKPPISQLEWLEKTPEGRAFTKNCMQHRYAKLGQQKLNQLATELYYEAYGLTAPYMGRGRPRKIDLPAKTDLLNDFIVEILTKALEPDSTKVLRLITNNK